MNINWKSAIDNIQSLVQHGSFSNRDQALADEEKKKKDQERIAKQLEQETQKAMDGSKNDELHQLKVQKEKVGILDKLMKMIGGQKEQVQAAEPQLSDKDKQLAEITKKMGELNLMIKANTNPDLLSPLPVEDLIKQRDQLNEQGKAIAWPGYQTATPSAQPSNLEPYSPTIKVPGKDGKEITVPSDVAQVLLNSFNDINQATNAAQVLVHPNQQTYSPAEIKRMGRESWNLGENPSLDPYAGEAPNPNGTVDTGMMRINDATYNEMKSNPYWNKRMKEAGIKSYTSLEKSPQQAADMARLILEYGNWDSSKQSINDSPNWRQWYAAPLKLRGY